MKTCPTCKSNHSDHYSHCPLDGTPLVEASMWTEGAVIRGKYRILGKIGQGGMGAVYKAQHVRFKELCAIKVMASELMKDPVFLKRFEHEAVLTRKLQHPNAVRVEDFDEAEDGRPFIVMEYIEGRSLKEVIAQEAPLSVGLACSIAKQVASALDAAHRLGMVHRDIKPDNIVLLGGTGVQPVGDHGQDGHATSESAGDPGSSPAANMNPRPLGGEGGRRPGEGADHLMTQSPDYPITAKVLDFGIAKMKEGLLETTGIGMTLTGTGMAIGTPSYMSPEQALGKKGDELDGRSDVYSLGVVMYQMLTGELPLKADTPIQMLMAHIQTPPRPLRETRNGARLPGGISDLVMQCLAKNPDRRPANPKALTERIEYWEEEPARQEAARKKSEEERLARERAEAERRERKKAEQERLARETARIKAEPEERARQPVEARRTQPHPESDQTGSASNTLLASTSLFPPSAPAPASYRALRKEAESTRPERGLLWIAAPAAALLAALLWYLVQWAYTPPPPPKPLMTLTGYGWNVLSVAWSPDGQRLVTGSAEATVEVWDAGTGKKLLTLSGHRGSVFGAAWSPDGKRIATASFESAKVWDAGTGKELLTLSGHRGPLYSVAWSPDGKRIATASDDRTAKVWDAGTGKELLTLSGHSSQVDSVTWSPDGKRLATGSLDNTAKVWDAEDGHEFLTLWGKSWFRSVAWSPDGSRLATGSDDKMARVWDAGTGKELLTLSGHRGSVFSVAWSPDGRHVATGSWDKTTKVWDGGTGKESLTLGGQGDKAVYSVAWSADGRRLAIASPDDRTVRIYAVDFGD